MNKVALISLYFGKFPANFGLWLKSAAQNADIDFSFMETAIFLLICRCRTMLSAFPIPLSK